MGTKLRFINNIIALSESDMFYMARHEWLECESAKFEAGEGDKSFKCICTHWVKHATFMKNIKTDKYIMVGESCKRRLLQYPGKRIHKHDNYDRPVYSNIPLGKIDDLEEYSKIIRDYLTGTISLGLKHHKAIGYYKTMAKQILAKILEVSTSKVVLDSTDEDIRKKLVSYYTSKLFINNTRFNFKLSIKDLEIYIRQLALLINNDFHCLDSLLDNCAFICNKKKKFMEIRKFVPECDFIED